MKRISDRLGFWTVVPLLLAAASCSDGGNSGSGPSGSRALATLEMDAEYPEPFSYLSGVRELPDGKLLAADPLSQVLLRLDLDAGTADTLGAIGGGPQEYRQPDQVFPLPGDSTLLVDLGKTYLTVVGPDGTFHDGLSMSIPSEDGPPSIIIPRAVDGFGRIYFEGTGGPGQGPADSTVISRFDRTSNTTVEVATLWRTAPTVSRSGGNVRMRTPRMAPMDDWSVGADGQVALIRANGYFVEWHLPDGETITGPETPYEIHSISRVDKEAELDQSGSSGLRVSIAMDGAGAASMQMTRGGSPGGGDGPSVEDLEWGETFPPFRPQRAIVSPRNEVWVQRWLPHDQTPRMDVFGPQGSLTGSVFIPERSQLIGFGDGPRGGDTAYFVRTDEVGLVWLQRYRVVRQ